MASTISADAIKLVIDRLECDRHRQTTKTNYHSVWKSFNEFFLKLDKKPKKWEDRLTLFVGH